VLIYGSPLINGFGGTAGASSAGTLIDRVRNQARLLLSNKDCADFLKGLIAQTNGISKDAVNLDNFLKGFDSLKIIPTPKGDPGVGFTTTAHVDEVGQGLEVHVDKPNSIAGATLLHEDFHTINFGLYDRGLAHNIWKSTSGAGPDPGRFSPGDASSYASEAFRTHCDPSKK